MKPDKKTKTFKILIDLSKQKEDNLIKKIKFVRANQAHILMQIQKLQGALTHYQEELSKEKTDCFFIQNSRKFQSNIRNAITISKTQYHKLEDSIKALEDEWKKQIYETKGYQKLHDNHVEKRKMILNKKEQQNTDEIALQIFQQNN